MRMIMSNFCQGGGVVSDEYYQKWYAENREKVLQKRRERYKNDPDYAERVRANARESSKNRKNIPKTGIKKERRPVLVEWNGKQVTGYSISHLAKRCHKTVGTIRHWIRNCTIPETPIKTEAGHRLYTESMIMVVAQVVASQERVPIGCQSTHEKVKSGWEKYGIIT